MRRLFVGAGFASAGGIALVAAVRWNGPLPMETEFLWTWLAFGAVTVLFFLRSAEVDDRLFASSSLMVILAAAITLSSWPDGDLGQTSVLVPITLLSAIGFYTLGDLKGRMVLRAFINLGQLTVSGFVAGGLVDVVLRAGAEVVERGTFGPVELSSGPGVVLPLVIAATAGVVAGTGYALVNLVAVRLGIMGLYGRSATLPWSTSFAMIRTEVAQGFIGAVLGALLAVTPSMALFALVLTVFVIGQLVFTSHAALRTTHEAMLSGFVKILETRDLYTRGHTERVVEFSRAIGEELGFSSKQLARMRLAALIHDVGKLAVPTEIMRKQGELTPEEYHHMRVATHKVDDLLSEVGFLYPMVTIYSGSHPRWDGESFGHRLHQHTRTPTTEQSVLAVADAFDAMTSTRSYRMAMPQQVALDRLTSSDDPLFDGAVVSALRRALDRRGGTYGPPASVSAPAEASEGSVHG